MRIAFDVQKLAMAFLGLLAAALLYGTFHWLGERTGEPGAERVFDVLGAILAMGVCVLCSGLIARMAATQLLEGRKAGPAELRQFARERWTTLLGIPLSFGAVALLVLGVEAVLTLAGGLPGIGPIVYSASFLLAFLLSLTAVLTGAVHAMGAFLYPTIVAVRGVGAVGAILEMVELTRRRPLHVLVYQVVVTAVGAVMTLLIGLVVWASLRLTVVTASTIMQETFDTIGAAVPEFFRTFMRPFERVLPVLAEEAEAAWHYDLSGMLLGCSLLVVGVLTLVYPFVFFTSAGSITYLILRTAEEPSERSPIEDL